MSEPTLVQHKALSGLDVMDATPTIGNRFMLAVAQRSAPGGDIAAVTGYTKLGAAWQDGGHTAGIHLFTRVVASGDGKGGANGVDTAIPTDGIAHLSEWTPCDIGDLLETEDGLGTDLLAGPVTPTIAASVIFGTADMGNFDALGYSLTPDGDTTELCDGFQFPGGNIPFLWAGYRTVAATDPASVGGTMVVTGGGDASHRAWSSIGVVLTGTEDDEDCDPGPSLGVYDPDDVFLGDLTDAFDVQLRVELNGTGSGQFSINRHSADASAALLTPGNFVRATIEQIDPDPIFGFFIEGGTVKLVSSDEEGGEFVTYGGRGGLAYWDRAIWLNESFLIDWWPAYIETAHGVPPAGSMGAVGYAAGTYTRYTHTDGLITSRIPLVTGAGFSSYYDQRERVHDADGNFTTLVHLTTGGVSGYWVKPYGAGITDYPRKSAYTFGASVLMENISGGHRPGQIIEAMYQEAVAASRPVNPIPGMTIDFTPSLDSNGDAWTIILAVGGMSADLGEDYLTTIGKVVNLGVTDVVMGPDLDMHAYNHYGRDLTADVRFAKGLNIADELVREFTDSPVGTFAEVLGSEDGAVARVELADAASRPPREISVRGDTTDIDILESLGDAELNARLLHSDAVGFNVATPIIGNEDPLNGLYLPGPPGSANGNYWIGDTVTLHTGTAEHDFNEETVRIHAITLSFSDANDLRVTAEVNSGFGGFQPNGGSSGTSTNTVGGGGGLGTSDVYQLRSERDQPMGYVSLDDFALIDPLSLGTGTPSVSTFLRGDQTWGASVAGDIYDMVADGGLVGDGSTDNSAAIEAAWAAGTVSGTRSRAFYWPPGDYRITRALQDTGAWNAQVRLPAVATSVDQITIRNFGPSRPPIEWVGTPSPDPAGYAIIRSTLTGGTGTASAISGGNNGTGLANINNISTVWENLIFIGPDNPTFTMLNLEQTQGGHLQGVQIATPGGYTGTLVQPTATNAYGVKMPGQYMSNYTGSDGLSIGEWYTCIRLGEMDVHKGLVLGNCIVAMEAPVTFYPTILDPVQLTGFTYGIKSTGFHPIEGIYIAEHRTSAPSWSNTVYDVDDAADDLLGEMVWWNAETGGAPDHSFIKNGGTALQSRELGTAGGAPSTADYLVGTANGSLSAEIVVGTTPGGELGGSWGSPTVDATHSGSTHAATQAAAEATAAAALAAHVASGGGEILISDTPSTPLIFADLVQNEAQSDLVYSG